MFAALLASVAALGLWADGQAAQSEPDRIARITYAGNQRTADERIGDVLELYPGMLLPDEAGLLRAEIRLLMRFHKRFDLAAGKRPTIRVLPRYGDSPFRDIEVRFPEKSPKKGR